MTKNQLNIRKLLDTKDPLIRESIIQEINSDEINQDVIDGVINSELTSEDLDKLSNRYYKHRKNIFQFKWVYFLLIGIFGISGIFYFQKANEKVYKNDSYSKSSPKDNDNSDFNPKITVNGNQVNSENKSEIKKQTFNSINELINKNEIKTQVNDQERLNNEVNSSAEELIMKPLSIQEIGSNSKELTLVEIGKEVYILDYKMLDYRAYRTKPENQNDPLNMSNGLPASFASKNGEFNENEFVKQDYFSFLTETIKYFDKKMYAMASENFETILKHYPDDVNALFYKGLCDFELKDNTNSITSFETLLKNKFINFYEEAQWNLVQVYIANGELQEAENLRNDIVAKKGFYAQRAKELIIKH